MKTTQNQPQIPTDPNLEPCTSCNTSGYVVAPTVPKKLLDKSQEELDLVKSRYENLQEDYRKNKLKHIKQFLVTLVIVAGLGAIAVPTIQYFIDRDAQDRAGVQAVKDKEDARYQEREEQRQLAAQAAAEAQSRKEAITQANWNKCLSQNGSERCFCLETAETPQDAKGMDITRCWRDASLLKK